MTLAVKVAVKPQYNQPTNQPTNQPNPAFIRQRALALEILTTSLPFSTLYTNKKS